METREEKLQYFKEEMQRLSLERKRLIGEFSDFPSEIRRLNRRYDQNWNETFKVFDQWVEVLVGEIEEVEDI